MDAERTVDTRSESASGNAARLVVAPAATEHTLQGFRPGRAGSRSSLRVGVLYRRFAKELEARPLVYWADMLASAAIGWGALVLACMSDPGSWAAIGFGVVSTFGLYRAVLFIHELTHLKAGAVPGFETVWNLVVGIPLFVPSLMYVGVHGDHHKRRIFGTIEDPEYAPMGRWTPGKILASVFPLFVVPLALPIRWGILAPLSLVIPPLRRLLVAKASSLLINPVYNRRHPEGRDRWRWALEETAACAWFWALAYGVWAGIVQPIWLLQGYCVMTALLIVNHGRTLAAHRYMNEEDELDWEGQLLDSINLMGRNWVTALIAPVGLRYHALHHLMPAMPYHSLGRVHRALLTELPAGSVYRHTERPGMVATVRALFEQAASGRHPRPHR